MLSQSMLLVGHRPCSSRTALALTRSLSSVNSNGQKIKQDHAHCVDLVQQRDREGYLCGLLMPQSAQMAYFAVRAFNVEVASIKEGSERRRLSQGSDSGSSVALRMRMQWWRDALNEIYPKEGVDDSPPSGNGFGATAVSCWNNPVVRALHYAVEEKQLTRRFLDRMLDAREADLDIHQLATMDDAIYYAEDSCSNLLYLSFECAGIRDEGADEVASSVGIGWGLVTAIRGALYRANNGEMAIPAELLTRKVSTDYLMARLNPEYQPNAENEAALKEAVQYMAYQASNYLNRARSSQEKVPRGGKACLLPAVPASLYLSSLQEVDFNLFDEKLHSDQSRLLLLLTLGRSWWAGKF